MVTLEWWSEFIYCHKQEHRKQHKATTALCQDVQGRPAD